MISFWIVGDVHWACILTWLWSFSFNQGKSLQRKWRSFPRLITDASQILFLHSSWPLSGMFCWTLCVRHSIMILRYCRLLATCSLWQYLIVAEPIYCVTALNNAHLKWCVSLNLHVCEAFQAFSNCRTQRNNHSQTFCKRSTHNDRYYFHILFYGYCLYHFGLNLRQNVSFPFYFDGYSNRTGWFGSSLSSISMFSEHDIKIFRYLCQWVCENAWCSHVVIWIIFTASCWQYFRFVSIFTVFG